MADAKWYVVHTYSGYENKVADTLTKTIENRKLQDYFFNVTVPVETVTEITDSGSKTVERKLFPGYVLVKMILTDETWYIVRNTRGVTGFVGTERQPVPLTEAEVEALGMDKHEIIIDYSEGDKVKVVDGPLENFIGVVEEIDHARSKVRVIVSMFGRETPVELELDQVEPVKL